MSQLSRNIQDAIRSMGPQNCLNGLELFELLSDHENEALQNSIVLEREPKNSINSTFFSKITTFITQKLYKESSFYHKRFKYFLGYYEELKSMHFIWDWDSLCRF